MIFNSLARARDAGVPGWQIAALVAAIVAALMLVQLIVPPLLQRAASRLRPYRTVATVVLQILIIGLLAVLWITYVGFVPGQCLARAGGNDC